MSIRVLALIGGGPRPSGGRWHLAQDPTHAPQTVREFRPVARERGMIRSSTMPKAANAIITPADEPIRIGVSVCLLGKEVRFDGQHKRDAFLVEELGRFVEWVPVCPEVEVGMGVPRESVRLVAEADGGPRMVGQRSGADWTSRMVALSDKRARALAKNGLSGFVLKSKSPSCGMERVKVYAAAEPGAPATRTGVGLFAAALLRELPNLPVEEEGRLTDAALRENFIERVFAYHRLQTLWRGRWTLGQLVGFHTAHKMALLAHSTEGYRKLGKLVAEGKRLPRAELRAEYESGFMATLRLLATRGRHANVLVHMFGHLRKRLDERDKHELLALVEDYRVGLVPLIVPVTLLRHHARRLEVGYLLGQTYLDPHPKELMLRNRV
jgi:uncharacterized protein YbgA (DUF1722 family)/uncharacterized protein YbbK (DUF523 family)